MNMARPGIISVLTLGMAIAAAGLESARRTVSALS